MISQEDFRRIDNFSLAFTAAALVVVLWLGLLPALLGGLLVYNLVIFGARRLENVGVIPYAGKIILLVAVALIFIAAITYGVMSLVSYVNGGPESFVALMQRMADTVVTARSYLPPWIQAYLPDNIDEWQVMASEWLLENARMFSVVGADAGLILIHLILGMIIGGMVALHPVSPSRRAPLAHALADRAATLSLAFRRIVFSQVRISGLNTILTGIFLAFVMPAMGYQLPFVNVMIVVTFVVGLMPIIGNIISNTVIFLIALSVSPIAAIGALVFLIVIHKLEYFVNAKIIGTQIRAHAWEILLALIVMDALFGIPGLIAAPVYYAYLKDELMERKLI